MAVDHAIEILIDDGESADFKANALRKILNVLVNDTMALTSLATSYSAGSTSANETTLNVGDNQTTFTADFAVRIVWDEAVLGKDRTPAIERMILKIFENETLSITHAAGYTAGDRAYNASITLT